MAEQEIDYNKISKNLKLLNSIKNPQERCKIENDIIITAVPLVKKIATHLARKSTDPLEDILQVGILGLIKAVKMFDCTVSTNFKTYATYFITGEIRHYFRDKASIIKAPREIYELAYHVNKIMNNYKEDNNLPTENELASELKTSVGKIREVMDVEKRRHVMSLDQILSYTDSDGQSLSDKIPCNNYNALTENQENRIMLKTALSSLDENLREVVTLHFFQDISQTKIAEMLGISQMQVSRRIKKALRCLFDIMNEEKEFKQND